MRNDPPRNGRDFVSSIRTVVSKLVPENSSEINEKEALLFHY